MGWVVSFQRPKLDYKFLDDTKNCGVVDNEEGCQKTEHDLNQLQI